ncbi:hypothetical protein V500_05255 [Pseudogymnoascus sp. VKM F-4518 (FW-2643)]|nr:hypothetical protein V500_05255 [Pseudogymnoascus sp. VKM F-4518 (FW-2643)]
MIRIALSTLTLTTKAFRHFLLLKWGIIGLSATKRPITKKEELQQNRTSASRFIVNFAKMPTIHTLDARDVAMQLSKRGNWASQEAGVIVVFCIVGVVAIGIAWLCIHKWMLRRRANRPEK